MKEQINLPDSLSEKVKAIFLLKITANWLDSVGNDILKPFQITIQQYNILRILRGAGESLTVQTVKERMIERSPNATRLMDKLISKKLIDRTRCKNDRRVVYVKINKNGLALLHKIPIENYKESLNILTDEESKILNNLLLRINQN
ncbi:MAG: MarR family transcriptional regulator [Flavobacteriaceae bacterium]|nr:MarR family transcriptional regulator [Flavobacteriaceae bacterium]